MPANLENLTVDTDWKRSVFITISKKVNAKECSNYHTIALISHASKVMHQILPLGFNRLWTENFHIYKRIKKRHRNQRPIVNICWIIEKSRECQKNIYFCFIDWLCQSLWLCGSQQTVENSERDGNTRPFDLPLEKSVCRSGSNS